MEPNYCKSLEEYIQRLQTEKYLRYILVDSISEYHAPEEKEKLFSIHLEVFDYSENHPRNKQKLINVGTGSIPNLFSYYSQGNSDLATSISQIVQYSGEEYFHLFIADPVFNEKELGIRKGMALMDILQSLNDVRYLQIAKKIAKFKAESNEMPSNLNSHNILMYLQEVYGKFQFWYASNKITPPDNILKENSTNSSEEFKRENELLNNQLIIAQNTALTLKRKIKMGNIFPNELQAIADKCRKKNGKLNYSQIGKELGISYHTAQTKCKGLKIE